MLYWTPPPDFAAGVLSANGHLNRLVDCANTLFAGYLGHQIVWQSRKWQGGIDPWRGDNKDASGWERIYSGYIRNKVGRLEYDMRVTAHASNQLEVRILYGSSGSSTITAAAGSGSSTKTGSFDVSLFERDAFYWVRVDARVTAGGVAQSDIGAATVHIYFLGETDPQTYSTLHRCYTGDVLTVADWQALSDRASTLYAQLLTPYAAMCTEHMRFDSGAVERSEWGGVVRHKNKWLRYDLRFRMPYWVRGGYTDDNGVYHQKRYGTFNLNIYYGATRVKSVGVSPAARDHSATTTDIYLMTQTYFSENDLVLTAKGEIIKLGPKQSDHFSGCTRNWLPASQSGSATGIAFVERDWLRTYTAANATTAGDLDEEYLAYQGIVDTSSLGLTEGTLYPVTVKTYYNREDSDVEDVTAAAQCFGLYEQQAATPAAGWWTKPPVFALDDIVAGATGGVSIKTVRDDLAALSTYIAYRNLASPKWRSDPSRLQGTQPPLQLTRRGRWLHYYCAYTDGSEEPSPSLGYFRDGAKALQEVSLPYEPNKWLVYDLDGIDGLWEGQVYRVKETTYAIEDWEQ